MRIYLAGRVLVKMRSDTRDRLLVMANASRLLSYAYPEDLPSIIQTIEAIELNLPCVRKERKHILEAVNAHISSRHIGE